MTITSYPSIITLNVNELNLPIKRHRMAEWIKKKKRKTHLYSPCKRLTSEVRTHTD